MDALQDLVQVQLMSKDKFERSFNNSLLPTYRKQTKNLHKDLQLQHAFEQMHLADSSSRARPASPSVHSLSSTDIDYLKINNNTKKKIDVNDLDQNKSMSLSLDRASWVSLLDTGKGGSSILEPLGKWPEKQHRAHKAAEKNFLNTPSEMTFRDPRMLPRKLPSGAGSRRRHGVMRRCKVRPPTDEIDPNDADIKYEHALEMFESVYHQEPIELANLPKKVRFLTRVKTPPQLQDDINGDSRSRRLINDLILDVDAMSEAGDSRHGKITLNSAMSVDQWRASHIAEERDYDSVSVYAEMRYIELKRMEEQSGNTPTKLKAAVCMDLILKIIKTLGRYAPIMKPLVWELANCIFDNFSDHFQNNDKDPSLEELFNLEIFREKYVVGQEAVEDAEYERKLLDEGNKMRLIVKKFQTLRLAFDSTSRFLRDACFLVWKKDFTYYQSYKRLCMTKMKKIRFLAWKKFVGNTKVVEVEDFQSALDEKIVKLSELTHMISMHHNNMLSRGESVLQENALGEIEVVSNSNSSFKGLTSTFHNEEGRSSHPSNTGSNIRISKHGAVAVDLQSIVEQVETNLEGNDQPFNPDTKTDVQCIKPASLRLSLIAGGNSIQKRKSIVDLLDTEITKSMANYTQELVSAELSMSGLVDQSQLSAEEKQQLQALLSKVGNMHKLTRAIIPPKQDQITQTPDEWVQFAVEEEHLPDDEDKEEDNKNSVRLQGVEDEGESNTVSDYDKETPRPDALTMQRRLSLKGAAIMAAKESTYKISIPAALQLIASIYDAKLTALRSCSPTNFDVTNRLDLTSFAKDIIHDRFGVKRLAIKHFKGLVTCCQEHLKQNKRLEIFADLCGLVSFENDSDEEDCKRLSFFYSMLDKIFPVTTDNSFSIDACMKSKNAGIAKHVVIEALPLIFPKVAVHDPELFINIVAEIDDLKNVERKPDLPFKVDVDALIFILMDYFDFESNLESLKEVVANDVDMELTSTKEKQKEQLAQKLANDAHSAAVAQLAAEEEEGKAEPKKKVYII